MHGLVNNVIGSKVSANGVSRRKTHVAEEGQSVWEYRFCTQTELDANADGIAAEDWAVRSSTIRRDGEREFLLKRRRRSF